MKYSKRIQIICQNLPKCDYFADIGCDHGYCTAFMLQNDLCKQAIITDISANSLKKAENLLQNYLNLGKLKSLCCNGVQGVDKKYQQFLIAGMGGEEIIAILQNGYLPQTLILQPMKNTPKVRSFLLENGYTITKDFTFFDRKFYDLICAVKDSSPQKNYSVLEIQYGYDNIHAPQQDFLNKIDYEIEKYRNKRECKAVQIKLNELYKVKNEISRHF